jgi:basic membrane protein A
MKRMTALFLVTTLLLLVPVVGCGKKDMTDGNNTTENGVTEVKNVAMALPGLISDQSFNYSAYLGLEKIKEMGYNTSYTEDVVENDIESVFRTYASNDYQLIMGHGYQFVDPAIAVAPDYPDKYFYVYGSAPADSSNLPANVAFSHNKEYEGAYVCGVMAALETKSNIIGFVGGAPSTVQIANNNAFREGAQSVNPDIQVKFIMTGTFIDPAAGREAAISLIEQGCDVLMHNCDATGTVMIDVCVEKDVKAIGYGGDQRELAPDQMLCCLGVNTAKCIADQLEKIKNNTFSGIQREGIASGAIYITEYGSACSQESIDRCNEVIKGISNGSIVPKEITSEY